MILAPALVRPFVHLPEPSSVARYVATKIYILVLGKFSNAIHIWARPFIIGCSIGP